MFIITVHVITSELLLHQRASIAHLIANTDQVEIVSNLASECRSLKVIYHLLTL